MEANAEARARDQALQRFRKRPQLLRLECGVQHYAWGDPDAIPAMLGIENPRGKPYAELWIGDHPDLPAVAMIDGVRVPLDRLVQEAADEMLGSAIVGKFGRRLPFLLKILASKKPLSIQAHPNRIQAAEGFARENHRAIPHHDKTRNYHDPHHKPELIVALTDFYALRGFRPLDDIAATLRAIPEFHGFAREFEPNRRSLINLYGRIMRLAQSEVDAVLNPIASRLATGNQACPFGKEAREHWVLRADQEFSHQGQKDRGIFSLFFLNLVHLRPGQALYLPAGELHSYLEGTGVEVMANSNNVLRGGLTPKRVDVVELLKILTFSSGNADILEPEPNCSNANVTVYRTPAEEFDLARVHLAKNLKYQASDDHGIHLSIVTEGTLRVETANGDKQDFLRGEAFLIPRGLAYQVTSPSGGLLYQAFTPNV